MLGSTWTFNRRLYGLVIVIACVCALLLGLTWLQGPRIRSASYDPVKLATEAGQRVILRTNQPIGAVEESDIVITPAVDFKAVGSGNTVILQFAQRLQYQTAYTIAIKADDGRPLKRTFETASPALYYLREDKKGDEIHYRTLSDGGDTVVYRASNIVDFLAMGDTLVVQTAETETNHTLRLITLPSAKEKNVRLPVAGTIADLHKSPNNQRFGFTISRYGGTPKEQRVLSIYDVATHKYGPLRSFDDSYLQVLDWQFSPDNKTVLAQTIDTTVLAVDSMSNEIKPLGQFVAIDGVMFNGSEALLTDKREGKILLDLQTLERRSLQAGPSTSGVYTTQTDPLQQSEGLVQLTQSIEGGVSRQQLAIGTDEAFYEARNPDKIVVSSVLSANDQYTAVQTRGSFSVGDNEYRTDIVNIATGRIITTIHAGIVRWQ